MTGWAVDVRAAPELREAVGVWLVTRTGQAVEERTDGTLVTYAEDEVAAERLAAELHAEAWGAMDVSRRPVDHVDWTTRWRDGLGPRRFGRLTVTPSWIELPANPTGPIVVLDPETAFGSGEHGSTRAALTLLERHLRPGDRVLDLGSGSGILSIAAVRLGAARATGIEIDVEANEVAIRNGIRNEVAGRASFLDGDASDLVPLLGPADLLLSNILRTVNISLLPAIAQALAPSGLAIFSGMEADEAPLFLAELAAWQLTPEDETIDAGWWAVAARRR